MLYSTPCPYSHILFLYSPSFLYLLTVSMYFHSTPLLYTIFSLLFPFSTPPSPRHPTPSSSTLLSPPPLSLYCHIPFLYSPSSLHLLLCPCYLSPYFLPLSSSPPLLFSTIFSFLLPSHLLLHILLPYSLLHPSHPTLLFLYPLSQYCLLLSLQHLSYVILHVLSPSPLLSSILFFLCFPPYYVVLVSLSSLTPHSLLILSLPLSSPVLFCLFLPPLLILCFHSHSLSHCFSILLFLPPHLLLSPHTLLSLALLSLPFLFCFFLTP